MIGEYTDVMASAAYEGRLGRRDGALTSHAAEHPYRNARRSHIRKAVRQPARRSSCCMAFPTTRIATMTLLPPLAAGRISRAGAVAARLRTDRFLHADTPRSGQQAALGCDLRDFMQALGIERASLPATTGADARPASSRRSGRTSCAGWSRSPATTSSRSPPRIVRPPPCRNTAIGTNGISTPTAVAPGWQQNRREICRLLWQLWSPNYRFDDATYERTAASFDNPDFVDVVIQSYRHRYGNAAGDPALEPIEQRLAARPPITMPTINLHGEADGVTPPHPPIATPSSFTGAVSAPRDSARRPFPAARSAACDGARHELAAPR